MALTVPPGIPSDGTWRVWFVPTMATPASPSIATDIGNAGTVDGSCLLTKSGFGLDASVEKFKDERLCTIQVFEQNGQVTYSINDIEYVIDPQTPASATNKLYAMTGAGLASAFIIIRFGMAADTAPVAAQKVWVIPVAFAPAVPLPPEANTMTRAKQSVTVTGVIQRDVALVA
jgi:hypothetical protein